MAESENSNPISVSPTPTLAPVAPVTPVQEILSERSLLQWLPICRRTLKTWRDKELIPAIHIGGRVFYHKKSVEEALLRRQR
ncbi:MAG: helix-turn-helix domain-containing protein [Verrucomicrobiia bacterium]